MPCAEDPSEAVTADAGAADKEASDMSSPGTRSTRPGKPVALPPVRSDVGIALAVCLLAGTPGPSAARDLTAVSAFVIPAYTAMNFATICAQESSWAGSQPRGPRGVAVRSGERRVGRGG